MREITLAGWCGIAVLALVVLSVNMWLFSLLRGRGRPDNPEAGAWTRAASALRRPFGKEEDQISELNRRVRDLQDKH